LIFSAYPGVGSRRFYLPTPEIQAFLCRFAIWFTLEKGMRHGCLRVSAANIISKTANISGDMAMNKVLGLAFVVYLLGDPSLSMIEGLSFGSDYIVALIVALITIPWVTAQIDN
jgi:hypothetical protein